MHLSFHLFPSFLFCWLSQTTVPQPKPPQWGAVDSLWLYLPPSTGFQAEVTARLMDLRGHRQVAGGPASEQPTQRCQSAGQTPAASPLVGRRGCTLGSGPVRPALHLTRLSSHRHAAEGLTLFIPSWFHNSDLKCSHTNVAAFMSQLVVPTALGFSFFFQSSALLRASFLVWEDNKPWCWANRAVLSRPAWAGCYYFSSWYFCWSLSAEEFKNMPKIFNFWTKRHGTMTKADDFKQYWCKRSSKRKKGWLVLDKVQFSASVLQLSCTVVP